MKILSIFGTRPEAIKMAPILARLRDDYPQVSSVVCVTGQHREMLEQVLTLFGIVPQYDLALMQANQTLSHLTAEAMRGLDPILAAERPDWVLTQGDTTTAMVGALAAFYHRCRVGHVEAGLRTFDKWQPYPEEINRRIADLIADLHFAPTPESAKNLLREGISPEGILVTGNTGIDALQMVAGCPYDWKAGPLANLPRDLPLILVTAHRRENFGPPLQRICAALRTIAHRHPDHHLVYPVHLNPHVREVVVPALGGLSNVHLLPPLDYLPLVHLMKASTLVLTDSGGIQEEAPGLGKPVLVLREVTERPEGVASGTVRLVGTDPDRIVEAVTTLLTDPDAYRQMAQARNPYGDGEASRRILARIVGN
jgi:UDP-N-acetylglucosamine 2-epimerase (non-hydrolysing)